MSNANKVKIGKFLIDKELYIEIMKEANSRLGTLKKLK